MEQKRGLLLFSPMGSGKTYYLNKEQKTHMLDGDIILETLNISNKNDYWYDYKFKNERDKIIQAFHYYLDLGYWIFYSGNPLIMKPDIIVLPDKEKRWNQLQGRSGYKPTREKFLREQKAYEDAVKNTTFYVNGDIPSLQTLECLYNEIIRQQL